MIRAFRAYVALALLFAASTALANFHLFRIEQLYSNADGTVQFIVMHEATNSNNEDLWAGQRLMVTETQTDPSGYGMPPASRTYTFQTNLPTSATSGRRVLLATPAFAALGLVTPDFTIPAGFLPVNGGTLNYAGADQITYSSLPTDGVSAINRNGAMIQNAATNFAGASASITAVSPPAAFVPQIGVWWNPAESGTGYSIDFRNGTLVIIIYTYEAVTGHSEFYLSSGPMTDNNTKYTGTLDKYRNGQCISCTYSQPTNIGNDGTISITFTASKTAVVSLPNNRTTNITPLLQL